MFPKHKRLKRADFATALTGAKRLSSAHFLVVVPRKTKGYAVIVSKKAARLSVTRHRIKRRVLAALRSLPSLPPALIVYPKASVLNTPFADLKAELANCLGKLTR